MADWPDDDDGGVLRSLTDDGFDFSRPRDVDYMIDFGRWPPMPEAIAAVQPFGSAGAIPPNGEDEGYVLVVVRQHVSYDNVASTQRQLTAATARFGENCEAWESWMSAAPMSNISFERTVTGRGPCPASSDMMQARNGIHGLRLASQFNSWTA